MLTYYISNFELKIVSCLRYLWQKRECQGVIKRQGLNLTKIPLSANDPKIHKEQRFKYFSFHVITGHYHSLIIIAHSSIHEFRMNGQKDKIFGNFSFRHICLKSNMNTLTRHLRRKICIKVQ